jgi:hypothetical protein
MGAAAADAVRATNRAATSTYFYGQYEPVATAELVETVTAERGVRFDLSLLYNDLSEFADEADDAGPRVAEAGAQAAARRCDPPRDDVAGQTCKVYLEAVPGADLCGLTLVGDTAYLRLRTMQALLRGIEMIVLEAAYRDVEVAEIAALTGLTPISADAAG